MFPVDTNQPPTVADKMNLFPFVVEVQTEQEIDKWLSDLSPDTPWGQRKVAARMLGNTKNPEALPALLDALPEDPFWMVRTAIIQALEMIGDPAAIPTLQETAGSDSFQVVRSHAVKAVERLSHKSSW